MVYNNDLSISNDERIVNQQKGKLKTDGNKIIRVRRDRSAKKSNWYTILQLLRKDDFVLLGNFIHLKDVFSINVFGKKLRHTIDTLVPTFNI